MAEGTAADGENIRITVADRKRLKAAARRTGISPRQLLASMTAPAVDGLTAGLVRDWIDGKVREAPAAWFLRVVAAWDAMPDRAVHIALPRRRKAMTVRKESPRIPLTGDMRQLLVSEIARADADYAAILEGAPARLKVRLIRSWKMGEQASVDAELWQFVIDRLASLQRRST